MPLSAQLPTEIVSAKKFVAPATPAPSIWESIANFGSNVVGVVDSAVNSLQRDKANKNAALDYAARNDTARAVGNLLTDVNGGQSVANTVTTDPNHNAAVTAAKGAAPQLAANQTAAAQGALPPDAADSRALATMRQLMAQHPGHEAAIATTLKELGVTNMITRQYDNAASAAKSDQDAALDVKHTLEKDAVTKYGFSDYYSKKPEEQATIRAQVSTYEAAEHDVDIQAKNVSLLAQKQDMDAKTQTTMQTQFSSKMAGTLTNFISEGANMTRSMLLNTLSDPVVAADPVRAEQLQSKALATTIPVLDQMFAAKVVPHLANLTPADRQLVTDAYNMQKQSLISFLSGPTSVVETNKRVFQTLSDKAGISFAQAAPTMMRLQKILGPQALGNIMGPAVLNPNSPLYNTVMNEFKRVVSTADPTDDIGFGEFLKTLSADGANLDPNVVRQTAPQQIQTMIDLSKNPTASNATDPESHKALVNSIRNTAGLAASVNEGWGFGQVLSQAKALGSSGVERALFFTNANTPERKEAINTWIPATVATYQTLSRSNSGDKFYSIKLDPHTLTWQAVWNGQRVTAGGGADMSQLPVGRQIQLGINPNNTVKPAPSSAVTQQVASLNHMLNRLSDVARDGWDGSIGKVSYQEARRFYAQGELPASSTSWKSKNGKTPEQNVDDAVQHMMGYFNGLKIDAPDGVPGETVPATGKLPKAIETSEEMTKYYTTGPGKQNAAFYQQFAPVVSQAATSHGVPIGVAMNVIHTESKFNPHADSGEAGGLGQISYKEAARRGWGNPKDMSPQENLDKSMQILAENYKTTGSWKDAVSMYLTGRPMAKAGNAHDKNGTTALAYAGATVPANVSWDLDTSGAMPIGVPTPYGIRY